MKSFLIALQFLTRIQLVTQKSWTAEDFGKSTRAFPLVGFVLGIVQMLVAWGLLQTLGICNTTVGILLLLPIILTGGLHSDGFMDTVDGVFSGRDRERKLEIMKDSRVGSYGVVAFVCLMFFTWSLLRDTPAAFLLPAVYIMPVVGRMAMTFVICRFPYARKEGMGKAFADAADGRTLVLALVTTLILLMPFGAVGYIALGAGLVFAFFFARYIKGVLGGLTGDVYGATELLTEMVVLMSILALSKILQYSSIMW